MRYILLCGLLTATFLTTVLLGADPQSAALAQFEPTVSGNITDALNKPVRGVRVKLTNTQTGLAKTVSTDRKGHFEIAHKPGSEYTLDLMPSPDSDLANAHLAHIPGDQTRRFVFHLKRGFPVSGRVLFEGKGIADMVVRAVPVSQPGEPKDIHGGGTTTTNGDGSFRFTLTPGEKTLVVVNEKYGGLEDQVAERVTVTGDTRVADIVLPLKHK